MSQAITPDASPRDGQEAAGGGYQVAVRTAAVAGVFSLIVCALLLYDFAQRDTEKLLEDVPYQALKSALAQQPENQQLRAEIRKADLHRRVKYFRQRTFATVGTWLLLGGVVVFLIAAKSAATLRRRLPAPEPQAAPCDLESRWTRIARWSVAGLAAALIALAVGLNLAFPPRLPDVERAASSANPDAQANTASPPKPQSPPKPPPSAEEIRKNWPRFRGPDGSGISAYADVPKSWDGTSGDGILWKVPVPLPGFNSPVVWADRVFLSGADENRREVYCFDANTGKLLWKKQVLRDPRRGGQMHQPEYAGYAAPTTATDGRYAFAIFANGDLAAFDFDGNPAWSKSLGVPENTYGHASSLATYGNLVLVQIDQGLAREKKSKLYAFNAVTGEVAWEVSRPVSTSWTSPIVISHQGRDQLITCSDPWVIAYNPADGKEIWRAKCLSGECGPSPVFASGVVHVGNEYCVWSAIRVDGEGDVTDTHVSWTSEEGLPNTCCPVVTEEFVFLVPETAYFTCLDAKTGELLWDHEFDAEFTSSPGLVGNLIYLFGEVDNEEVLDEDGFPTKTGMAWILEPNREGCQVIGQCPLGEGCVTSPAFQEGRIYIRGSKHLFCIGKP